MPLQDKRAKLLELLKHAPVDDPMLIAAAKEWFLEYKGWESEETFHRALQDNRMTARQAGQSPDLRKFETATADGKTVAMNLEASIHGVIKSLDPDVFIQKKKNELGLHHYSAVLLKPGMPISKQVFPKVGSLVVFMPIPLEEDLQAFHELSAAAKQNRDSDLYTLFVGMRARMTRIQFGSADDMKLGFLAVDKGDGKTHIRYGMGNVSNKVAFGADLLKQRSINAMHYKSEIATKATNSSINNEVTVAYRHHAGIFPWFGNAGPIPANALPPGCKQNEYLVPNVQKQRIEWLVHDDGSVTHLAVKS